MFSTRLSLSRYTPNHAALVAATGLSLIPIASAFNALRNDRSIQTLPSLKPAEPSSEFSEWLLSGYLGDFLEWSGKKLADIGSTLFPTQNLAERRTVMRANKQALRQFFAEKILGADVDAEISESLAIYLRHGIVLRNAGILTEKEWMIELIELQAFSKYTGDNITATLLLDYIEQLTSLLQVKESKSHLLESEKSEEVKETTSTSNFPLYPNSNSYRDRQSYARKYVFPSEIDLLSLGNIGITINGINAPNGEPTVCVRNAGDFNGDGFNDVIIGGAIRQQVEYSYVIFGSAHPSSTIDEENLGTKGVTFTGLLGTTIFPGPSYCVSGAGDVNGDGYDDVILASPLGRFDLGEEGYVVFGSATPLNMMDLRTLGSNGISFIYNDGLISSVSGIGDFNGDNYDDVILTSYVTSKAYIVFGSSNPATTVDLGNLGSNGIIISGGGQPTSVSSAEDFNSDGYDDIIISLLYPTSSYVIFGSATSSNTIDLANLSSNGIAFLGISENPINLPISVSGAGDVNGDGYADVIIGAPYAGLYGTGESYVIFGSANPVSVDVTNLGGNGITFTEVIIPSGCCLAWPISVSGAGDFNADGYADVLIGGGMGGTAEHDNCYLVFGSAFPNSTIALQNLGSNGVIFTGAGEAGNMIQGAISVSSAGDFDGDGYDDIIIGSAGGEPVHSYIIFSMPISTFQHQNPVDLSQLGTGSVVGFEGSGAGDSLGAVSNLGDVNNDGIDDFILGAPNALKPNLRSMSEEDVSVLRGKGEEETDAGECYLVLGSKGFSDSKMITIRGAAVGDQAGYSVGAAGDVNGDGIPDIIIGAPKSSPRGLEQAGTSYVIFGREKFRNPIKLSALNGHNGFRIEGIAAGDESGHTVNRAGDVNGDGYDDVIIGAPLASRNGRKEVGESYVVFGKRKFERRILLEGLNGVNGFKIRGLSEGERLGGSVSGAGDMNGDGYADIVMGARRARDYAGRSYVLFGRNSFNKYAPLKWLNGRNGFVIDGIGKGDLSGGSVSGIGDMNRDGYDDIVIGAHHASPNGWRREAGEAYVILGTNTFNSRFELSALDGSNGFKINGEIKRDYLGKSVHGAGDVNDDGYADVIVGANGAASDGKKKAGKSYVIFGQSGGFDNPFEVSSLDGTNGFEIDGAHRYDGSGFAVSGAGDVDGDGYGDVLVSAWRASPNKHKEHAGEAFLVFGGVQARRLTEEQGMNTRSGNPNRYGFFVSVGANKTIAAMEQDSGEKSRLSAETQIKL